MKIIGLTGGIGSGKSTASAYLQEKGCIIIDADKISRQLTEKQGPCLDLLRATFGEEFFFGDGSLDRKKLGAYVFANPDKKALLEKIVTEEVIRQTVKKIETLRNENFDGVAVLDAPLFFECGMREYTDESWLVAAGKDIVIERVKTRDKLTEDEIESRIVNQMPLEQKKALADRIIDNSASRAHLYEQLDREMRRLKNEE